MMQLRCRILLDRESPGDRWRDPDDYPICNKGGSKWIHKACPLFC
jgi:hypothetical protein